MKFILASSFVTYIATQICCRSWEVTLMKSGLIMRRKEAQISLSTFLIFSMVSSCGLHKLEFNGYNFTWWNRREANQSIEERLDRLSAKNTHANVKLSDNLPILVKLNGNGCGTQCTKHGFKFENIWALDMDCEEVIKSAWNKENDVLMSYPWRKSLLLVPRLYLYGSRLPLDMFKRSRIYFLKHGDSNSKWFHSQALARRVASTITKLVNAEGNEQTENQAIEQIVVTYFHNLFSTPDPSELDEQNNLGVSSLNPTRFLVACSRPKISWVTPFWMLVWVTGLVLLGGASLVSAILYLRATDG
ncbi:hypothetical protein Cgig2_030238 [Carnegiea gigantea]|uniref:Uncharacterized protein n=1 Tax=Carnegiea gigantea TaxID=171969 RepID=A0A9Q1KHG5_9CARY|nr:hypothetical protein Cgig2_030238 [Carnegiea gigantea]